MYAYQNLWHFIPLNKNLLETSPFGYVTDVPETNKTDSYTFYACEVAKIYGNTFVLHSHYTYAFINFSFNCRTKGAAQCLSNSFLKIFTAPTTSLPFHPTRHIVLGWALCVPTLIEPVYDLRDPEGPQFYAQFLDFLKFSKGLVSRIAEVVANYTKKRHCVSLVVFVLWIIGNI